LEGKSRLKISPRQRGRKQHFGDRANKLLSGSRRIGHFVAGRVDLWKR
jgi:hypothetical protein